MAARGQSRPPVDAGGAAGMGRCPSAGPAPRGAHAPAWVTAGLVHTGFGPQPRAPPPDAGFILPARWHPAFSHPTKALSRWTNLSCELGTHMPHFVQGKAEAR